MRKRQETLDLLDRQILVAMSEDPLASYSKIRESTGTSVGTVYLRTQRLRDLGVIRGAQLILDPQKLGYTLFAVIRMHIPEVEKATKALADRAEVGTVHVLTGEQNLLIYVYLRDVAALNQFLQFCTHTLKADRIETQLVMDTPVSRAVPIPPSNAGWAPKRRSRASGSSDSGSGRGGGGKGSGGRGRK